MSDSNPEVSNPIIHSRYYDNDDVEFYINTHANSTDGCFKQFTVLNYSWIQFKLNRLTGLKSRPFNSSNCIQRAAFQVRGNYMAQTTKGKSNSADTVRVLVSTKQTQGVRKNDFCFVPEGEPVRFGIICDSDNGKPDSQCGCARSLVGFYNKKATTTFKVDSINMTRKQYIKEYIKNDPYYVLTLNKMPESIDELITSLIKDAIFILNLAEEFEKGTVLEYRAGRFFSRETAKS